MKYFFIVTVILNLLFTKLDNDKEESEFELETQIRLYFQG
jgi:hypothetical protein